MSACGQFNLELVKELKYVYTKLTEIVNNNILINSDGIGDGTVCCGKPDTSIYLFDCKEWCKIRALLSNPNCGDDFSNVDYLETLISSINCILSKNVFPDYGILAQINRFKCIIENLKIRINSVACNNKDDICSDIVGDLLCVLIQLLTLLISAIIKLTTMVYYSGCYNSSKIAKTFIDCLICDFVNDLCALERLLDEFTAIANAFNLCLISYCTPCTVAPSAPIKRRPICPPPLIHSGHHGHRPTFNGPAKPGCGCN